MTITYMSRIGFGRSVTIYDDTIVVGAPMADTPGVATELDSYGVPVNKENIAKGAVYVFIALNTSTPSVTASTPRNWTEQTVLQAADKIAGQRFGESVDIDKDQLIVGAPGDLLKPRTDWTFETGTLAGWTATGTAFAHQPTYGTNTMHRSVYTRMVGTGQAIPGPPGTGGFVGK